MAFTFISNQMLYVIHLIQEKFSAIYFEIQYLEESFIRDDSNAVRMKPLPDSAGFILDRCLAAPSVTQTSQTADK